MDPEFQTYVSQMPDLYAKLMATPLTGIPDAVSSHRDKPGIYVLYENGKAVHVGRTRNIAQRLRGHTRPSHYSATFAFKQVRIRRNLEATYKPTGSRKDLMNDEAFKTEFHAEVKRVAEMQVRFLEVGDAVLQYLLELYAHLALGGLSMDEFDTH